MILTFDDTKINDGSTPPKTKSVNNDSLRPIIYPDSPPNIQGNLTCHLTTVLWTTYHL